MNFSLILLYITPTTRGRERNYVNLPGGILDVSFCLLSFPFGYYGGRKEVLVFCHVINAAGLHLESYIKFVCVTKLAVTLTCWCNVRMHQEREPNGVLGIFSTDYVTRRIW